MTEKININGIELHVASQDELIEEADKQQLAFMCMPTKFGPPGISASRVVKCEHCKQDVWISPATYSTWQSCDAPIVCIECLPNLKN